MPNFGIRISNYSNNEKLVWQRALTIEIHILYKVECALEKQLTIADIYHGELDAKDEVIVEGLDPFVESFIMPDNLDIDKLFSNSQCFISGYKGTGKTALLYYLENYLHKKDTRAVSIFIPFKENYNEVKRINMENTAQKIISPLVVNREAQTNDDDFEYIWSWELFKIIIDANGKSKGKLFVFDDNWKAFKRIIKDIAKDSNISRFVLKASITYNQAESSSVTASIEPEKALRKDAYQKFVELIDEAYESLKLVTRTDIPFYIFIDELEAYYGNPDIFRRDLRMIRDLIFTTKRINMIFWKERKFDTKIICAFRTEILNAINRFVIPKEINKAIGGFDIPLRWNYNNTNSIEHPIMRIFLRRIQMAEQSIGNKYTESEIYKKWFPAKYNNEDTVCYILNYTWNKPRDIVRFLLAAQSSIKSSNHMFSKDVFDSVVKTYSLNSLDEVREEMRAIYSNDDVENILQCFKGFRVRFTTQELKQHLKDTQCENIIDKIDPILRDLYRLGMIGNYSALSDSYHWQHKGDEGPIISDEWQLQIHSALLGALQLSKRHDQAAKEVIEDIKDYTNKIVQITVEKIEQGYAGVTYQLGEKNFYGIIFKNNISSQFVENISDYLQVGYKTQAKIITYDKEHGNWLLTLIF
jgi:hypothetical protein